MNKIFDCITFFSENFMANLRFEILKDEVDYFVICESIFDHKGNKKKINFNLKNNTYKNKIIHLIHDKPFHSKNNEWQNQAEQREYIFNGLNLADEDDYIMFSDPDEIPNPITLRNLNLKKNLVYFYRICIATNLIFLINMKVHGRELEFVKKKFKINRLYEAKNCLKKLKTTILENIQRKSIDIFKNGGWHFNSLLTPEEISLKLKTFAHTEFAKPEYSDVNIIKQNIQQKKDLFKRNLTYTAVELDNTFPKYILENKEELSSWIV